MSQHKQSIEELFRNRGYIADQPILTALKLVQALQKPLLIEGPAGVGKTEIAKVLADSLQTKLIRLQCYEGLDVHQALYEWDYARQMIHIRMTENEQIPLSVQESTIFSEKFLLERPLLQAFKADEPVVLLIDEIDRADEGFEAFLLEALAEYQITIPELGTIKAAHFPYVILTSNRTRDLSDALRRRCLYQWIDYPDFKKEVAILEARVPEMNHELAVQIADLMEQLRQMPLQKTPGIAESLVWAQALVSMHQSELNKLTVEETLGCFVKNWGDWGIIQQELEQGTLLKSNKTS